MMSILFHLSTQASFEANADLYAARRKHFESSLDYYSEINGFQLKRKFSLMEPLLTFMHAQVDGACVCVWEREREREKRGRRWG